MYASVTSQPRIVSEVRSYGSRSGIWVGIFAIAMSFAAFTSALYALTLERRGT